MVNTFNFRFKLDIIKMKDKLGQLIEKGDKIVYTTKNWDALQEGEVIDWDYERKSRGYTAPMVKILGKGNSTPGWTFPDGIMSMGAYRRKIVLEFLEFKNTYSEIEDS